MSNVQFRFEGMVVAVTGAAIGIGKAAAQAFSAAGAHIYLLDIDETNGPAAADGVGTFLRCDVTSPDSVAETFAAIDAAHGRLDVLVNNAGGFGTQRTTE